MNDDSQGSLDLKRILLLFCHPALEKSRIHRTILSEARDLFEGDFPITFHDLYQCYPDFFINVKREHELLLNHDIIIFQHPFYWYSGPSLLKEWMDQVLEYGFAYGPEGNALKEKYWLSVLSAGGSRDAYEEAGQNQFAIHEFLRPFQQTASLCGMCYLPPFVIYGSTEIKMNFEKNPDCQTALSQEAKSYKALLKNLVSDDNDLKSLAVDQYTNQSPEIWK